MSLSRRWRGAGKAFENWGLWVRGGSLGPRALPTRANLRHPSLRQPSSFEIAARTRSATKRWNSFDVIFRFSCER